MGTDLLKSVYLFKELSPKEMEALAALVKMEVVNPGDEVFSEGDTATSLYVIKYGSVRIRRAGTDANASVGVEIAQLGTGSHFGELSFIDGEPRSATVSAIEKSEILRIGFDELKKFFQDHPLAAVKFYHSLAHFLCGRLRVTTMDLSFAREKNFRHF